jgi:hypothetical protein
MKKSECLKRLSMLQNTGLDLTLNEFVLGLTCLNEELFIESNLEDLQILQKFVSLLFPKSKLLLLVNDNVNSLLFYNAMKNLSEEELSNILKKCKDDYNK